MKPFALDSVLKYRKQKENAERQKLFQVLKEKASLTQSLQTLNQELAVLFDTISRDRQEGTTVERLVLYENRIIYLQGKRENLTSTLETMNETVARRKRHLLKATQDRKVMDKLRVQQNAAYKTYLNRKEAAMLDEIAVLYHDR